KPLGVGTPRETRQPWIRVQAEGSDHRSVGQSVGLVSRLGPKVVRQQPAPRVGLAVPDAHVGATQQAENAAGARAGSECKDDVVPAYRAGYEPEPHGGALPGGPGPIAEPVDDLVHEWAALERAPHVLVGDHRYVPIRVPGPKIAQRGQRGHDVA